MGVLSIGRPLTWSEIVSVRLILKNYALNDLISILTKHRTRRNDDFLWGDEIEYSLLRFDHSNKRVQLSLKADKILSKLTDLSEIIFHAEDCNFVVEGVPAKPYDGFHLFNYNQVELNMKLRREEVQKFLSKDEYIMTISLFPRLGCVNCTYPWYKSDPIKSFENSICCSDQFKSLNHPRTMYLNANVNKRRQGKVSVNVPIYKDLKTPNPFEDDFSSYEVENWEKYVLTREDDHIHLDSSSIGWGCCCLQVTFQAASFDESLKLYDQLIPLTPIFLGLSTACPIWKGYLSDVDSRWNILRKTSDDRTKEEIENNIFNCSRYSSVSSYLSNESEIFNDIQLNIDQDIYQTLIKHGDCPSTLAKHFANLFTRDPLYVTDKQVYPDEDSTTTFAFENQNSMIWNTLRYKPPPSPNETSLGWRIEFRPMELQITDMENAALAVFLSLLTRAILSFNIDLRIPISLVNQNMERAQTRNTIQQNKFHFRKTSNEYETCEMTMDEIINGSNDFIGLKSFVIYYLNSFEDIHLSTRQTINNYLQFISQRAKGILLTNAMWIREFVLNHPLYQHDSIVDDQIQYDLMWLIQQMSNNEEINSFIRSSNTKLDQLRY